MKKIVLFLMVFMIFLPSFGQTQSSSLTKDDYLQKSKNQKTTGWILLAGGTTMFVAGLIITENSDFWTSDSTGPLLATIGVVTDLVSIPFFISSSNNARNAATISFGSQKLIIPQLDTFTVKNHPSITLRLEL